MTNIINPKHVLERLPEIMNRFSDSLDQRFKHYESQLNLVTEDCVRYEFYGVLLRQFLSHEIVLEYPHDTLPKKEIDLVLTNKKNRSIYEFKYYRAIPSGQEDRTARMANIYVDLMKLKLSNIATDKYFVFVTDKVMYGYLKRNQYEYMTNQEFFDFKASDRHQVGLNFGKVVYKKLSDSHDITQTIQIQKLYLKQLEHGHSLFIYKVT